MLIVGERFYGGDAEMAAKVYNKVIRTLREVLQRTCNVSLDPGPGYPTVRFERVVERLEEVLTENDRRRLAEELDVEPAGSVAEMVGHLVEEQADGTRITDVDELTPNAVKVAIYEVAFARGVSGERVDVPLDEFLRVALDGVFSSQALKGRLNVGANRHFPRLLQYVRECEDETWWSETERGLWVKNASGRGKVAEAPRHPADLKITINLDLL